MNDIILQIRRYDLINLPPFIFIISYNRCLMGIARVIIARTG